MKIMHLADLHLGKSVNGFSMLGDQRYILEKILEIIRRERPDAVLMAGDIYDRTVPSAEAVQLLDDFLYRLSKEDVEVLIISGNHDSPERLSFCGRLMDASGIHIAPVYGGHIEPVVLADEYGPVYFWMLPFVKPAQVRPFFPKKEITSYTDAVRAALDETDADSTRRNVLVTHQFVTGASRCDSEEISVGGSDNVDASVFNVFDYVALGHIHGPQNIGSGRIRYCGTPLKYSFSESAHQKSVTMVELGAKDAARPDGKAAIRVATFPLQPLHDMRGIRGKYDEVTALDFYRGTASDDYLKVTLTDEEDVPEAYAKLRVIYPNLMKLEYDNRRTRSAGITAWEPVRKEQSPEELFADFYEMRNGAPMTKEQASFMAVMMEKIWSDAV